MDRGPGTYIPYLKATKLLHKAEQTSAKDLLEQLNELKSAYEQSTLDRDAASKSYHKHAFATMSSYFVMVLILLWSYDGFRYQ